MRRSVSEVTCHFYVVSEVVFLCFAVYLFICMFAGNVAVMICSLRECDLYLLSLISLILIRLCYFVNRGTGDIISAHGIPRDLLDRIIIVRMKPYGQEEVAQIIQIRAQTEGIKIENDAIQELSNIAEKASLR